MKLEGFIKEYYPEWYGIQEYPADKTVSFLKVDGEWGLLSNFARTPIVIDGVTFDCTEKLFQVIKFTDEESRKIIYSKKGQPIKMMARHQEKVGSVREDWGRIFIDVMKFCLMQKYAQSEAFRGELERTAGRYIVEKEPSSIRHAGAWSAKLSDDGTKWIGPNIMGRLLMELRDKRRLEYSLPEDAMRFPDLA
jgi:ribA/ribD-fused uncharacterized protein